MDRTNRPPHRSASPGRGGTGPWGTPESPTYVSRSPVHPLQESLRARSAPPPPRRWPVVVATLGVLLSLGVPAMRHLAAPPAAVDDPAAPPSLTLLESLKAEPTLPADTRRGGAPAGPRETSPGNEAGDDPAAAEPAQPAPVSRKPFRVLDVTLGREVDEENAVREARDRFLPLDEIHASVQTEGSTPGVQLGVRWTTAAGRPVAADARSLVATGPTRHDFKIDHPTGWPKGEYRVEVTVDGTAVASRDFAVH